MVSGGAAACEHCGRPLAVAGIDLPFGLGNRTVLDDCPCLADRRVAEASERRLQEHQQRVRRLLQQSGIGVRHQEATFDNFEATAESRPVLDLCRGFVEHFPDTGKGLTLAGPSGTGKTYLAVAITRALIERGIPAVIVNVPRLFLTFRSSFQGTEPRRFEDQLDLVTTSDHLVLDDLGRERLTDWVLETLYLVVNARYEDRLATTITTNLDLDALRLRLGEPLVDRLAETNQAYWCQWPSWRRRSRP
ncbi:MAG: ATP-binding protein [Candidatus Rokuibacteriota bacterium]